MILRTRVITILHEYPGTLFRISYYSYYTYYTGMRYHAKKISY